MDTYSSGVRISYDDLGRGEPVLLLMTGWCADRRHFEDLVPRLSSSRRCLVIDWPGHGESGTPNSDYGEKELVEAAMAVIDQSNARRVVTVSAAHAGWASIELRRQLGDRIEGLVLLDWLVLDPPKPFLEALSGMQSRDHRRQFRDGLFSMWLAEIDDAKMVGKVQRDMGSYGYEMWARAGREIGADYARFGSPLSALNGLRVPPHVTHLFSIPKDENFLKEQQEFAKNHSWFSVHRLDGKTHFPALECPGAVSKDIEDFLTNQ